VSGALGYHKQVMKQIFLATVVAITAAAAMLSAQAPSTSGAQLAPHRGEVRRDQRGACGVDRTRHPGGHRGRARPVLISAIDLAGQRTGAAVL